MQKHLLLVLARGCSSPPTGLRGPHLSPLSPPLTSFSQRPPAGDPAEEVGLQLVSGRRQAGWPSAGGPVQLEQSQVVVVAVVVVVLVQVDALHPRHLLGGAAAVQKQLPQVDRPHGRGVETAGGQRLSD